MKTGTEKEQAEAAGMSNDAILKQMQEMQATIKKLELERVKGLPQAAETGGISADQLERILNNVTQNKAEGNIDYSKVYSDGKNIPEDDYDPKGILFCSYSTGYVIVDDIRNGFPVKTPYGRIFFFQLQVNQKVRVGNVDEMSSYSSFMCHSFKEQEWLRKHKYFGVCFFESAREAMSTDAKKVQKLMELMNAFDNMPQTQIVARCREYHVPVSEDLQNMRILLAHKVAESQMAEDHKANEKRVLAAFESEAFK